MNKALQIAGQCWGDPDTSHLVMDPCLANAFAKRLAKQMELIDRLDKQLYEGKSKSNKPIIEVGDWVSFYRAVAPGSNVTNAVIGRVLYITESSVIKGTMVINTDQGPVGDTAILEVRKASE